MRSYSPENHGFEVFFVGKEQIWKMSLAPTIVRWLEQGESFVSVPVHNAQCASNSGCGI